MGFLNKKDTQKDKKEQRKEQESEHEKRMVRNRLTLLQYELEVLTRKYTN